MEALEIWYWTNLNFLVTGSCQRVFCSPLQAQACQELTDNLVHYFAAHRLFFRSLYGFFFTSTWKDFLSQFPISYICFTSVKHVKSTRFSYLNNHAVILQILVQPWLLMISYKTCVTTPGLSLLTSHLITGHIPTSGKLCCQQGMSTKADL